MFARALLSFGLLFGLPAAAATYSVDATHSTVSFEVDHMVITTVQGVFEKFEGAAEIDGSTLKSVEATVDVASVNTRDTKRDDHLRGGDFFDAEGHPQMTFKSKSIKKDGDGFKMTGELTIRGVTREVTFDVDKIKGPVTDPWGNTKVGTRATATINRQDFGVNYNSTLDSGGLMVGDDVTIVLNVELVQAK
jgi:polyisoprenoid-binding protein YceI